jgi:hypothetical protein
MSIFYKPSKKDIDELYEKFRKGRDALIESAKKLEALKDFKERTGLKGQELKKAFEEFYNKGNPKDEIDNYIQTRDKENIMDGKHSDMLKLLERSRAYKASQIKLFKEPKTYKEENIMNCLSDLKKKGNKYSVNTEFNINNDIDDKVKRALIKSIIEELNKNFDEYEFFYQKKN